MPSTQSNVDCKRSLWWSHWLQSHGIHHFWRHLGYRVPSCRGAVALPTTNGVFVTFMGVIVIIIRNLSEQSYCLIQSQMCKIVKQVMMDCVVIGVNAKWRDKRRSWKFPLYTHRIGNLYCAHPDVAIVYSRAAQQYLYYNLFQYILSNIVYCITIYSNTLLPIKYLAWWKVLQCIVLLFQSIAIYWIVDLKYCNILYCWSEVLQFIVLLN